MLMYTRGIFHLQVIDKDANAVLDEIEASIYKIAVTILKVSLLLASWHPAFQHLASCTDGSLASWM